MGTIVADDVCVKELDAGWSVLSTMTTTTTIIIITTTTATMSAKHCCSAVSVLEGCPENSQQRGSPFVLFVPIFRNQDNAQCIQAEGRFQRFLKFSGNSSSLHC